MLTDFQILQHGPGSEDAHWTYEAQLCFGRRVAADARKEEETLIRQMLGALEKTIERWQDDFRNGKYDSDWPPDNELRAAILPAIAAARARLDPQKLREGETT